MNRSQKKIVYNCRKKVIFGERKVPKSDPSKLVWIINMQGSTFMPVNDQSKFTGDPQVKQLMLTKIIPEINKNIGKIWINEQQHTYKSQIFSITHTIMRILLFILTASLSIVLLASGISDSTYTSILLMCLYLIWGSCVIVLIYTFTRRYREKQFQTSIVKEIKEILCQYNGLFLKCRRYVAKCDQWGTWICVARLDKAKKCSVDSSSLSDSQQN